MPSGENPRVTVEDVVNQIRKNPASLFAKTVLESAGTISIADSMYALEGEAARAIGLPTAIVRWYGNMYITSQDIRFMELALRTPENIFGKFFGRVCAFGYVIDHLKPKQWVQFVENELRSPSVSGNARVKKGAQIYEDAERFLTINTGCRQDEVEFLLSTLRTSFGTIVRDTIEALNVESLTGTGSDFLDYDISHAAWEAVSKGPADSLFFLSLFASPYGGPLTIPGLQKIARQEGYVKITPGIKQYKPKK